MSFFLRRLLSCKIPAMSRADTLHESVTRCGIQATDDEKGQAQIFLDRLFKAFGLPGALDVGGHTESCDPHESPG